MMALDNIPYMPGHLVCMETLEYVSRTERDTNRETKQIRQNMVADLAHIDVILKRLSRGLEI